MLSPSSNTICPFVTVSGTFRRSQFVPTALVLT